MHDYWKRQEPGKPLYPDIEWSKPEQRSARGRLGIIGGNKLGFAGVAESYKTALETGAGEVRVLLPDVLRRTVPVTMTDVVFGASNPSGGLAQDALDEMRALGMWSSCVLLIGDAGRNSETAIAYETFTREYQGQLVISRDTFDLIRSNAAALVGRPSTTLVLSFAQLQKLFREVYYPKVLVFSMQLLQLVEAVHKFTITYPVTLVVLHKDTLVIAHDGQVATTAWEHPMAIWRGTTATQAACYQMWTPTLPLEAIAASVATNSSRT
jgi:NAD(P)H-hydrate repair Nnr-like enzyme with NAD(P)H-hydrate dehydratase domain